MQKEIKKLFENYPDLKICEESIKSAFKVLTSCYENDGKILLCGNGGSAADCEHIVGELMKKFKINRFIRQQDIDAMNRISENENFAENIKGALPAISLASHVGFITAFNNDENPEFVFAQQLYALGNKQDVLFALSTSGNSPNVVNAAITAKAKGMKVIGMTGEKIGKLDLYGDVMIKAPADETSRIQEYHLPLYHTICEMLENYFFAL